jgi:3'-phosphoadenosine 5'-phosphosulfate sulfotransferase (PAPS reductase)/FAD synthetase
MIDKNRRRTLTVISLGAGVQSSTMAIMAAKGDLPPVDVAIFADTGNEPKAVYTYLNYLS